MSVSHEVLVAAMQRWGYLEAPVPAAADRWIDLFLQAYGSRLDGLEAARPFIAALRAEACVIPALELERLRSRDVLFFLDSFGQHVDHCDELRGMPVENDCVQIGAEFGLSPQDALYALRMALTGEREGPSLNAIVTLLGHERILMRIGAVNSRLLHGRGLEPIAHGPGGVPFEPIRGTPPEKHA